MSNRIKRQIARAPETPKLTPAQELVQIKAWQYEASVQATLWTQRGQQLHTAIVQREGDPQLKVLTPAPEPVTL